MCLFFDLYRLHCHHEAVARAKGDVCFWGNEVARGVAQVKVLDDCGYYELHFDVGKVAANALAWPGPKG